MRRIPASDSADIGKRRISDERGGEQRGNSDVFHGISIIPPMVLGLNVSR